MDLLMAQARREAHLVLDVSQGQRGTRYGHIEMAQTATVPDELRLNPVAEWTQYLLEARKALALTEQFGPHMNFPLPGEPEYVPARRR